MVKILAIVCVLIFLYNRHKGAASGIVNAANDAARDDNGFDFNGGVPPVGDFGNPKSPEPFAPTIAPRLQSIADETLDSHRAFLV